MHDSYKIQWKQDVMARKCNTCGSTNFLEIVPTTNFLENTIKTMANWYSGPASHSVNIGHPPRKSTAIVPNPWNRLRVHPEVNHPAAVIGNLNQIRELDFVTNLILEGNDLSLEDLAAMDYRQFKKWFDDEKLDDNGVFIFNTKEYIEAGLRNNISQINRVLRQDVNELSKFIHDYVNKLVKDKTLRELVNSANTLMLKEIIPGGHDIYSEIEGYNRDVREESLIQDPRNARRTIKQLKIDKITSKISNIINFEMDDELKKYRTQIKDWISKSPFDKQCIIRIKNNLNLEYLLNQKVEQKQLICRDCGTVGEIFFDIESVISDIKSRIEYWDNACQWLTKFDSSLVNWEIQRKEKLARQRKARAEKKRLEEIEQLEAEQKAVQERLKKLKKTGADADTMAQAAEESVLTSGLMSIDDWIDQTLAAKGYIQDQEDRGDFSIRTGKVTTKFDKWMKKAGLYYNMQTGRWSRWEDR